MVRHFSVNDLELFRREAAVAYFFIKYLNFTRNTGKTAKVLNQTSRCSKLNRTCYLEYRQ